MLEIKNSRVYAIAESIIASGYPMLQEELDEHEFESQTIILNSVLSLINEYTYKEIADKINSDEFLKHIVKKLKIDNLENFISKSIKRICNLGNVATGTGHDNFAKGILVQFDVKYPGYWTPQFQRYHFADIVSSMSKMHRLVKMDTNKCFNKYVDKSVVDNLNYWIKVYNKMEKDDSYCYLEKEIPGSSRVGEIGESNPILIESFINKGWTIKNKLNKYEVYMKVISNCPMGFEMTMRVTTSYLQLKTIYLQRKHHKLKEDWTAFCTWCESLPLFKEICLTKKA
ncbi:MULTISPECIES: hypothetical protein [Bacteria]|uniref:hypothetical protein n=1 Tax=Bacteria TaxID=2 RepID=UPI003F3AB428